MSVFDERKQTFKNKTSAATTTLISVTVSCLPFLFSHELGQLTVKWMSNRGRFRPSSRRRSRCPPGHDTRVQLVSASESGSAKSRRFQRDFLESVDRFFDSGIEGWWWLVRHVFVVLEKREQESSINDVTRILIVWTTQVNFSGLKIFVIKFWYIGELIIW